MSWARDAGSSVHAETAETCSFCRLRIGPEQFLNLLDSLCQARQQSIWLGSFETRLGLLRIAAEPPDSDYKLDLWKALPN